MASVSAVSSVKRERGVRDEVPAARGGTLLRQSRRVAKAAENRSCCLRSDSPWAFRGRIVVQVGKSLVSYFP